MPPSGAGHAAVPRPSREVLRLTGPPLPLSRLARRALRQLPHARAELHGDRRASRSRHPDPAPRSHGEDRNAECVLGVPRRPDARVGRRCGRALVRRRPASRGALRRGAGGGTRGPARGRGGPREPGPGFLGTCNRARHGAGPPPALRARERSGERRGHAQSRPRGADRRRGRPPARLNLARLLNELGRNPDAERVLRDGIARVPDQGELQYSLGLLLGEEDRLPEAAAALGRAADLMPTRARVRYNEALALQRLGRRAEAEAAFVKAEKIDPEDPEIAYALAVLYAQGNDWSRARDAAARLAALSPGNPRVQELLDRIRRRSP